MPPLTKKPSIRLKSYGELDPHDVSLLGEAFLTTGSYVEAALAAGETPAGARQGPPGRAPAPRQAGVAPGLEGGGAVGEQPGRFGGGLCRGAVRSGLARSLEDAALTAVEEVAASLEVLSASRKGAKTLGDKVSIVEAINETAKVVSTMRVAESKMRGDHAPTKVSANVSAQFSNLTDDELEREIAALVKKTLGGS